MYFRLINTDLYSIATVYIGLKSRVALCVNAVRDYCQWDTFKASCPRHDQLVVMKSAVYGRMASGSCIERDYGYVGCQSDVLYTLMHAALDVVSVNWTFRINRSTSVIRVRKISRDFSEPASPVSTVSFVLLDRFLSV